MTSCAIEGMIELCMTARFLVHLWQIFAALPMLQSASRSHENAQASDNYLARRKPMKKASASGAL